MDRRDTPREPFLRFHATVAAVMAEREAQRRQRDDLVVQIGRAIVIERVRAFGAQEHYEAGGPR